MRFKRLLLVFEIIEFTAALIFAGFNIVVDPFGVFGDKNYNWYSYDMTNNPGAAKEGYLKKNAGKYNAFILGGSSASAYSVEKLHELSGYNFYNMFTYDSDMSRTFDEATYLLNHANVKCLIVNVGLDDAESHAANPDVYKSSSFGAEKISYLPTFLKYAFAPPKYALNKISLLNSRTYLPKDFNIFNETTGSYNIPTSDAEPINEKMSYLFDHRDSGFLENNTGSRSLPAANECLKALSALKRRCDRQGVRLIVVFEPTYAGKLSMYNTDDVKSFLSGIANITDYWCFSFNSVCGDCRYFYDTGHFRNAVGTMAMAKVYGDTHAYVPDDYGVYITKNNIEKYLEHVTEYNCLNSLSGPGKPEYTAQVKILLYHNVTEDGNDDYSVSEQVFAAHMKALSQAGYKTITFNDLIKYVENGVDIPDKSVVITFDDGYKGVYNIAYPILREYGMRATVFVIGVSVGKNTNKGTNIPITPHFSYAEAQDMIDSGLISIQTHTYDMHMAPKYDGNDCRVGVLRQKNETEKEYITAFKRDLTRAINNIERNTTEKVSVLSYPYGQFTMLSEVLSTSMGIKITLTTNEGSNTIIKGLPQSLHELKRYGIENISTDTLLQILSK